MSWHLAASICPDRLQFLRIWELLCAPQHVSDSCSNPNDCQADHTPRAFSIGAFIGPFAAGGFITRFGPERGWVIAVSVCVAVTNATAIPSIFFVGEPVRVPPGVEYSKLDDETTLEGGGPPARPLRQLKLTTKGLPPDYKQRQSAVDRRYARLE